jgi:hypothetical protein
MTAGILGVKLIHVIGDGTKLGAGLGVERLGNPDHGFVSTVRVSLAGDDYPAVDFT